MTDNHPPVQQPSTKQRIKFGLKTIAMIILLLLLFILLMGFSICYVPPAQQRENFLAHIHSNAPEPYKDCMKNYIDTHWDAVHAKYNRDVKNDAVRVPRGETDVVNQMIKEYLRLCEK